MLRFGQGEWPAESWRADEMGEIVAFPIRKQTSICIGSDCFKTEPPEEFLERLAQVLSQVAEDPGADAPRSKPQPGCVIRLPGVLNGTEGNNSQVL
ncbi:MAG: hypothetical protein DIKNOCCD_00016 [bacterium]|nr:hypothetical protein [Candidatus Omnitrophota bacterium]MBV6480314.1 hypothetical protein [bacterium]